MFQTFALKPIAKAWAIKSNGPNFRKTSDPKNFEKAIVDTAFQTNDSDALNIVFDLIESQKIILGGSSGINIAGAIKLAKELSKRSTGKTLFILDEPTTGLHFADIELLLNVLNRLKDQGNTILVIEHNLDVVKTADWIIDLGPEGGSEGGCIVASGSPEDVANINESYTGQFLKKML